MRVTPQDRAYSPVDRGLLSSWLHALPCEKLGRLCIFDHHSHGVGAFEQTWYWSTDRIRCEWPFASYHVIGYGVVSSSSKTLQLRCACT